MSFGGNKYTINICEKPSQYIIQKMNVNTKYFYLFLFFVFCCFFFFHALTILKPSSLTYFPLFVSFFGLSSSSSLGVSFFCEYFFSSNPPGNFSSLTSISLNFGPVVAGLLAFTNLGGGLATDCSSLALTCDYS